MKADLPLFNLSDPAQKLRLIAHIGTLRGVHRVELTKVRNQASMEQRGYYWAVVLPHVALGIRDAWGDETMDSAKAHEAMKDRFLKVPIINKQTGEVMGHYTRSTMDLDTAEFAHYLDQIILLAAEYLHVEVPPPVKYHGVAENPDEKQTPTPREA